MPACSGVKVARGLPLTTMPPQLQAAVVVTVVCGLYGPQCSADNPIWRPVNVVGKGCRQCEFANWFDDRMPKSTADVNLAKRGCNIQVDRRPRSTSGGWEAPLTRLAEVFGHPAVGADAEEGTLPITTPFDSGWTELRGWTR